MKSFGVILLLVCVVAVVVSASVEVHNYSFESSYFPFALISGEINVSIFWEDFNSVLTSNKGDSIVFGKFLKDNGVIYYCSPPDCSNDYMVVSSSDNRTFSFGTNKVYEGFVLKGENVNVTGISFDIESDFDGGLNMPLSIDFFDGGEWKFNKFSDIFSEKFWGCYDSSVKEIGPRIGTSSYCELVGISETDSVVMGADIGGADNKNLTMDFYSEDGGASLGHCDYNPNSFEGCRIFADSFVGVFEAGKYRVCVKSNVVSGYTIYTEDSGVNCGFVYSGSPASSVKDYSIFARTAQYAGAESFSSADLNFGELVNLANNLLVERYGQDCSNGCVLPMAFSGFPQSVKISNLDLDYTVAGEFYSLNNISSLEVIPASVDFDGILDLSLTGFKISDSGSYSLSLNGEELFEEEVELIPAPIITFLSPINPPAGVPVTFYVGVDFGNSSKPLTYSWKFENSSVETTSKNSVVHTFAQIKNYSVVVEVSAGGNLTSKKSFIVSAVSPREAVENSLISLRKTLEEVKLKLGDFPLWYNSKLEKMINYTYFDGELTRLERAYNVSYDDSDFLKIAKDLFSLNMPINIFVSEEISFRSLTQRGDIEPQIVLDFAEGSSYTDLDEYIDPILAWQEKMMGTEVSTRKVSVNWLDGSTEDIFRTYLYNVTSYSDDESYMIIRRPFSELFFKDDVGARKAGDDDTVIVFDSKEDKIFEFYYESFEEIPFFISPKLSKLVIAVNLDESCNFNLICEKDSGENPNTCRSDCKPVSRMILYIVLAVFFVLIFYTFLQIWYEWNYEDHLFGDRKQLYNLLMYITNALARGKTENDIRKDLSRQGWSSERLTYVFKKSLGKRTGMVEIIPINKIMAYWRNRVARRKIVTDSKQQTGRNINKSVFQRRPIRR